MIAHAVTGSPLWNLRTETQTCRNEAVAESVETSAAEARFDAKRRAVLALLDFAPDEPTVIGGNGMDADTSAIFARLLALPDGDVLAVLAVIMGETLARSEEHTSELQSLMRLSYPVFSLQQKKT